jgi:hypothetical protein
MNRLILLFFAKAILCFHLCVFIRTTEISLSAFLIVIFYGMNIVFEISDFRRGVALDLRYCGLLRSVGWLLLADLNVWPFTRVVNLHLCNILGHAGALIGFLTALFFISLAY